MGKKIKAVGAGLKHFLAMHNVVQVFKTIHHRFQAGDRTDKALAVATVGLYIISMGTGQGTIRAIFSSIKKAKDRYDWLKGHEDDVENFLEQSNLSEEGKESVMKAFRNDAAGNTEKIDLSYDDQQKLKTIYMDMMIEGGKCVNF